MFNPANAPLWGWIDLEIQRSAAWALYQELRMKLGPADLGSARFWADSPGASPEMVIDRGVFVAGYSPAETLWTIWLRWILKDAGLGHREDLVNVLLGLVSAERADLARETLLAAREEAGLPWIDA